MKLPILNAFKKKIGQTLTTQLLALALPSFELAAFT